MSLIRHPVNIVQGATYRQPFRWMYRDEAGELQPVDLTGCELRAQIRRRVRSPEVVLDLVETGCLFLTDPEQGRFEMDIAPEFSSAMTIRSGVYDLEIEFPEGRVYRFATGPVRLDPEVTRDQA